MAKTRILNEFGMGTSLRRMDYTEAARRAIKDANLVFGKDVSIIIHDDDLSYFRNMGDVPLFSAVRSSVREAGRQSAEMLLEIIRRRDLGLPEGEPMQILMEAELMIGQSTGPFQPESSTASI